MFLYNVTVKLEPKIHTDWVQWMQTIHIPDVMQTKLFESYRMCKLDQLEQQEEITYVIQYYCLSRSMMNLYFEKHAAALRDDAFKKFGDQFIAFRTVMEIVAEG